MKYAVIIGDGMADYPVAELHGRTPLMVARTPHLDWLAQNGEIGLIRTIPAGLSPGSEVANLSILGYDPRLYYTGRGPLEAASLGIPLGRDDIAFRCNLVTLNDRGAELLMEDFSAGHISDDEAKEIILDLDKELGTRENRFYAGVSYRHLMVWVGGLAQHPGMQELPLTPPHDIAMKEIRPYLPQDGIAGSGRILELMRESRRFLKEHPVNLSRRRRGLAPANSIWLWGQGKAPQMPTLKKRFGIQGYVISAVHLLKGIGTYAGLEVLDVPGATGYFDTDYEAKARYALQGLGDKDFVYVHVEAPDEAGHMGEARLKIESIEALDEKIVGVVLDGIRKFGSYRVLVMPDHPTPISVRTHTADPVPFVIYSSDSKPGTAGAETFDEVSARNSGKLIENGFELMEDFLRPSTCA